MTVRPPSPVLALIVLAALVSTLAPLTAPARADDPRAVLAVEDTMRTEVTPELVSARRVTLGEILDRVARGEARRDSLLLDQSFTATLRLLRNTSTSGSPELFSETVARVYKRRPSQVHTVELRRFVLDDKDDDDDDVAFSPSMGEEIVNFAIRAENRRDYRFTIEDRTIVGDHIVYTLAFEPRSSLAVYEPRGRIWVDTRENVIVRQELEFEQSPVPLLLRRIPHMVVERTRVGDFWVLSRALVRVEFTVPLPRVGRSADFAMMMTDYTINTGLPDSVFTGAHGNGRLHRMRVRAGQAR
ncbi:MAG: hypothetical protein RL721_1138 [Candidatus Eisenbacteria bacterium]|jgi:hypothetical protein